MKTLNLNPFFFPGGPVGCLLIHGGAGSPPEMRPMGEYLADRGLTVFGVRLAGHGTTPPEDLATTTWQDVVASAEEGLSQLQDQCADVFVAGLSLGGLITLYLAAHHPTAGAIVMATPAYINDWRLRLLPIIKYFIKWYHSSGKLDLTDPAGGERVFFYRHIPVIFGQEVARCDIQPDGLDLIEASLTTHAPLSRPRSLSGTCMSRTDVVWRVGQMTEDQLDELLALGQLAIEMGQWEQARAYFNQALELDPSNEQARHSLQYAETRLAEQATPLLQASGPPQDQKTSPEAETRAQAEPRRALSCRSVAGLLAAGAVLCAVILIAGFIGLGRLAESLPTPPPHPTLVVGETYWIGALLPPPGLPEGSALKS